MWAALGNILKKKLMSTALGAANGDESSKNGLLIVCIAAISLFLVIIVVVIVIAFGPVFTGIQYVKEIKDGTSVFFEKVNNVLSLKGWCSTNDGSCQKNAEQEFYEELNSVAVQYRDNSVEIDSGLITGTIFYGYARSLELDDVDEDGHNLKFIDSYCSGNAISFTEGLGCPQYVLANYDEIYSKYHDRYLKISLNYDVLSDLNCSGSVFEEFLLLPIFGPIGTTFTRKDICEYYLWNNVDVSSYSIDNSYLIYKDGKDDIKTLAKNMVSGRRINLTNYRDYLVQDYIPAHYKNLYRNSSDEEKAINKIADEIMLFASVKENNNYASGDSCVTYECNEVWLTGDYAGKYSLDDYVKGVVFAESGGFSGYVSNYVEEWKAQAIAARSMVLAQYDICNESVPNTTNFQAFKTGWSQELSDAVDETAGMVLSIDGSVFLAQYDAFYMANNFRCDSELCYADYKIRGAGYASDWQTHTISTYARFTGSFADYPNGHGFGMSQWGAAYLADLGWNYEQILDYYYADEVSLSKIGSSCANLNIADYDWRQCGESWSGISFGSANVCEVGCMAVSMAIQIAHSNTPLTVSEFDPGVLIRSMISAGAFRSDGYRSNFNGVKNIAPNFNEGFSGDFVGMDNTSKFNKIVSFINEGGYPLIEVSGRLPSGSLTGGHFVAAVGIDGNDIVIVDPAGASYTRLFASGYSVNGYRVIYFND